jgi:hypothetical protein
VFLNTFIRQLDTGRKLFKKFNGVLSSDITQPTEWNGYREEIETVASIIIKAETSYDVLTACRFVLPGEPVNEVTVYKPNNTISTENYLASSNDKYCSFTLKTLMEQYNGLWWYSASSKSGEKYYKKHYLKIIKIASK